MPAEETLADLRQRYLAINAHACSYVFKALRLAPVADSGLGLPGTSSTAKQPKYSACGAAGEQTTEAVGGRSPCGRLVGKRSAPAPSCSLHALGSGSTVPLQAHQSACGASPEGDGPALAWADSAVPGGSSGSPAEAEVRELDLNATLAHCGLASPGAAEGDDLVLLLYWTDDLTPSC